MTQIDDLELGQRLRALRVAPPANCFETRLAERLLDEDIAPAPAPAKRAAGRVLVGPRLRRTPGRLIGATALLIAGAAAALEGGVVEWVQTRVLSTPPVAPASPPEVPRRASLARPTERVVAPAPAPSAPAPDPRPPASVDGVPSTPPAAASAVPAGATPSDVPRLHPERPERSRSAVSSLPERRTASEPLVVPRVEIGPRPDARVDGADARVDRPAPAAPDGANRERGRDLERLRDIARARRDRGNDAERPRPLERWRDRRDRAAGERRDIPSERGRRERPIR